jgi:hypothetical protein
MRSHLKVYAAAMVLLAAGCGGVDDRCVAVNARIATTYATDAGCTSPVGVCTTGNVMSGNLAGTTRFTASTTGPASSPGLTFYTGDLVITTADGTVSLRDHGVLNPTNGYYFELQNVTGGTGAHQGKTGMLVSQGTATPTGFEGILNGSICEGY